MPKPVIFSIDDDPSVLNSIERDLRAKYGSDYRIIPINSGKAALEYLKKMEQRNETVALFLVDQRMPEMNGTEFLAEAMKTYPQAKRVLLTAYADTQAAIDSINEVRLDYYLMKPWHPPNERLYPILDELLEDWKAHVRLPYEGIRVAGALWSLSSHQVKDFLTRHQIPYQWLDVEKDEKARKLVEGVTSETKLPVIFFPDGKTLIEPDLKQLADKVGLQTQAGLPFYDIIVIGSGPAGLAAAVYAGSEGYKCLVIEKAAPGGQAGSSPKIENYLGFPSGISGDDLTRRAVSQAKRFGVEILSAQEASRIVVKDAYRIVQLKDGTEISSHAVLIATGASFHILKMPGADKLTGAGIYYGAAYTEAMNYKDGDVFVVGGANSAAQGAIYLSQFARKVTVLVRGHEPTASKHLVDAMQSNPKIEILTDTDLLEVKGSATLEQITFKNTKTNETQTRDASALFVFIGVRPQSQMIADLVKRSDKGYVYTGPDVKADKTPHLLWTLERDPFLLETSTPGIFAAGDVRFGTNHRVASAVGEGAIAYALMKEYLKSL
ncbi:MAG: fused response regulator/thioredoxin-disulfide reductase [Anaerolineae bacterium]|nr:MAG: fused response regulator/thioredoxin-disulfide reductase [Anaerolineae bacterium]WKZ43769.1 MAG: FAD-dependent oxidoreductase [Anaerolineales bacterium]